MVPVVGHELNAVLLALVYAESIYLALVCDQGLNAASSPSTRERGCDAKNASNPNSLRGNVHGGTGLKIS